MKVSLFLDEVVYSNELDAETYSTTSFQIEDFSDVIQRKREGDFAKEYNVSSDSTYY